MHFLLLAHLLDRVVIDFVHGLVGQRGLAGRLQQFFHQQLVAGEGEPLLEHRRVGHLLVFGRLRHQNHVGDELHQVVLLGVRRHRRQLAGLVLGDREVALVDLDAVDLGEQRVLVLRRSRAGGHEQQRQSGGEETGRAAERGMRSWRCPWEWAPLIRGRRTCHPTTVALQWRTAEKGPNDRVSRRMLGLAASRQLTIIRPPPMSRLTSAGQSFAGAFASYLPEKCRISGAPEAKSGRRGVLEAPASN